MLEHLQICSKTLIAAIEYLCASPWLDHRGVIGNWLGRRRVLIEDVAITFIGLLMPTSAWGMTQMSGPPAMSGPSSNIGPASPHVGLLNPATLWCTT